MAVKSIAIEKWSRMTNSPVVFAACPGCGDTLRLDHEIAADGTLTPSLQCPLCDYHESGVVLEGWTLGAVDAHRY